MKKSASVGTVGASTCGRQHLMSRDLEEVSPPVQPVVYRQTLAQTAKQAGASESTPTSLECGLENLESTGLDGNPQQKRLCRSPAFPRGLQHTFGG